MGSATKRADGRAPRLRVAGPPSTSARDDRPSIDPGSAADGRLSLARLVRLDPAGGTCRILRWGAPEELEAEIDPGLEAAVAETASRTGEPVVVVEGPRGPVVVGALRTRATPGVDRTDELTIEAKRFRVEADQVELHGGEVAIEGSRELRLRTKTAYVILRAASEIESFADRIVTRAEGVHKLVGRMLRLN
jgi:hypothetical protein